MSQTQASHSAAQQISAPFRAKSAAVSLVVVALVGMYYFANLLNLLPADEAVPDGALSLIITTILMIIVVEIVLQIVLFVGAGQIPERTDADQAVASKAARNAYFAVTIGIFAAFASMFAGFTAFEMGSILLLGFLLAEIVKFGSQAIYYQRAA